jgi:hypothetical protein
MFRSTFLSLRHRRGPGLAVCGRVCTQSGDTLETVFAPNDDAFEKDAKSVAKSVKLSDFNDIFTNPTAADRVLRGLIVPNQVRGASLGCLALSAGTCTSSGRAGVRDSGWRGRDGGGVIWRLFRTGRAQLNTSSVFITVDTRIVA